MAYLEADLGVIKDARRRQRRRRAAVALALAAGLAAAGILAYPRHVGSPPTTLLPASIPVPALAPATFVPPRVAFWQAPYMGVACPVPNSIACDRVGLAVWLRRPAVSVTAMMGGVLMKLFTGPHSLSAWRNRPQRTGFMAYLQPAGLATTFHMTTTPGEPLWFGERAPTPLVRFRINYGHGDVVATHEQVMIMAGWG